jgi:L-fucose mutarotase
VWDTYKEIIAKHDSRGADAVGNIDRFDFYDEEKDCYCILQTGETEIYANIILQKGVIK